MYCTVFGIPQSNLPTLHPIPLLRIPNPRKTQSSTKVFSQETFIFRSENRYCNEIIMQLKWSEENFILKGQTFQHQVSISRGPDYYNKSIYIYDKVTKLKKYEMCSWF